MTHTYTAKSVTKTDDTVVVVGTADGVEVTVRFWASAVATMTSAQQVAYVAGLMLAAVPVLPEDLTSQFPSTATI